MKRKKLTLNKLTLGYLTDIEQARIAGGNASASNVYINTECPAPLTMRTAAIGCTDGTRP